MLCHAPRAEDHDADNQEVNLKNLKSAARIAEGTPRILSTAARKQELNFSTDFLSLTKYNISVNHNMQASK